MNDKTQEALVAMAEKLGTTAEHLWSVLIKQAAITGTIHLVILAAWVWFAIWSYRLVRRKTKRPAATPEKQYPHAEWDDDAGFIAWFVWGLMAALMVTIAGCELTSTLSALLNPEYFALKPILSTL